MGENTKSKRQYTGCACRCGQPTYATYLPGHDAKHVARLASWVIDAWGSHDVETRWKLAIKQLDHSYALQSKFRRTMRTRTAKNLGSIIDEMCSPSWQTGSHVAHMIARVDPYYSMPMSELAIATIAAAMGMSRHTINYRNS